MKEVYHLRLRNRLVKDILPIGFGKILGDNEFAIRVVEITRSDPYFELLQKRYRNGEEFILTSWSVKRNYTKQEIGAARLFRVRLGTPFEPCGEDCGTEYEEATGCRVCGAGAEHRGPLYLRESNLPRTDIGHSIADEIVVRRGFAECFWRYNLTGPTFNPIYQKSNKAIIEGWFEVADLPRLANIVEPTNVFNNPLMTLPDMGQICPVGDTIGLNLVSEVYVDVDLEQAPSFFATKQFTGVRRGMLRETPVYLAKPDFFDFVKKEDIRGLSFEIAHLRPGSNFSMQVVGEYRGG
ncbi:hypothetical protein [Asticcacaulis biprosthecium]|uniref:hypothetical protein n=1 Tax=Asticcacaulis biprosthecium TaxID=76891 RepID=UPI0012F50673|nr:hypothetical protein [Asticcacaulis biprosthecium]